MQNKLGATMIKDNVFLSAVTSLRLKEYKLALSLLFYKVGGEEGH